MDWALSDNVDFFEFNTIAAKVTLGSTPMYAYLNCFTKEVWILLVLSLVSLAMISKLSANNSKSFGYYLFNYIIIFFKQELAPHIKNSVPYLIIGLRLLSALLVSIEFTAFITEFMVTTVPVIRIKTLEQLSKRQDLKIIVRDDSSLVVYANKSKPLDAALAQQLEPYYDFWVENIGPKLIKGLRDGSIAYISDGLLMICSLIELSETHNVSFDSVFISRGSSSFEPYFLSSIEMSPWASKVLNSK